MAILQDVADVLNASAFFIISVLVFIQMVVLLFTPPEKAQHINYLGKILEYLIKVRVGKGECDDRKSH